MNNMKLFDLSDTDKRAILDLLYWKRKNIDNLRKYLEYKEPDNYKTVESGTGH